MKPYERVLRLQRFFVQVAATKTHAATLTHDGYIQTQLRAEAKSYEECAHEAWAAALDLFRLEKNGDTAEQVEECFHDGLTGIK